MTYSGVVLPLAYKTPANFNELGRKQIFEPDNIQAGIAMP
jgi:hypothetical protein